jgi:alpha-ribazole phosphatase CobZ
MDQAISISDALVYCKENQFIIKRENNLFCISNSNNNCFNNFKKIILYSVNNENKNSKIPNQILENKLNIQSNLILEIADIKSLVIENLDYITTIASAHNLDLIGAGDKIKTNKINYGSINIILLINKNLNNKTLMNAYSKAIEGKIAALWDLDVRSPSYDLATGNNNDNLITACTGMSDEQIDDKELQYLVGKCVRKAVKNAMLKSGYSKGILDYIEEIGIKIDDLVEAGMELCVGVKKSEELYHRLHQQILKSLQDLNVVSFIIAGIRLEEDYMKHRVDGVNVDDDPAYLYSDEVLGMSIANQIAGTKAIFNFKRYDEEKPGIIRKLGPVLDDVFAGLIAGCMSKIFEN